MKINEGIIAYAFERLGDEAQAAFEDVLRGDPENLTALYYLGIIELERGLEKSGQASTAEDRAEVRQHFTAARGRFETIARIADRTARPVEAALLLGISQLASDDAREAGGAVDAERLPSDMALKLAEDARDTLDAYTRTEEGREDRLGFFFLAVAHYRIMFEAELRNDAAGVTRNVAAASAALDQAHSLAEIARHRGGPDGLSEEDFKAFELSVQYYKGLLAIRKRDNARAQRIFEEIRDNPAARAQLQTNASRLIVELEKARAKTRPAIRLPVPEPFGPLEFSGEISIGGLYDDNVILLGESTLLPLGIPDERDYAGTVDAGFNIKRFFGADELGVGESLTIGIGGQTGHAWHPSIREFDLNTYLTRAFVNWQPVRDLYLGVQYEYSYIFLGHEPFISSNRLTPIMTYVWRGGGGDAADELGQTDVYYTLDDRDYRDEVFDRRLDRDGSYHALGARHRVTLLQSKEIWSDWHENDPSPAREFFADRWLAFYVGYEFRDERTAGTEFDMHGNSILTGIEVPLPWRLSFGVDAEFAWDDYNNRSLFDFRGNARRDFIQRYDFGLTYVIVALGEYEPLESLEVKLRGGVGLTFQDSNTWDRLHQRVYEYDRAVYSLTLAIGF